MSRAALAVNEERSGATALPADVAQHRLAQRREMLVVQALSDEAGLIVERLRAMVAELDWNAFAIDMAVTISAGLASLAADDSSDAILARADRALYAAKAGGRNRIATDRM